MECRINAGRSGKERQIANVSFALLSWFLYFPEIHQIVSGPFGCAENQVILSIFTEHGMIYISSYFMNRHMGLFAATSQRCVQKEDPLIHIFWFHAPVSRIFVLAANATRHRHPCHQLSHRPRPGPQTQIRKVQNISWRVCNVLFLSWSMFFCFSQTMVYTTKRLDGTTPMRWWKKKV